MSAELQVYINGSPVTLDLFSEEEIDIRLTLQIADAKDVKRRTGYFAKTIKIPATPTNLSYYNYIQNANIKSIAPALGIRDCTILCDGLPVMQGIARLEKVSETFHPEYLELNIVSGANYWAEDIETLPLRDLDLGDMNYTQAEIEATWAGDHTTHRYIGAPINFGAWRHGNFVHLMDIRPSIYFTSILKAIFNSLGFTVESDFFETGKGSKAVLQYAASFMHDENFVTQSVFKALQGTIQVIATNSITTVAFPNDSTNGAHDVGNNYDNTTYTYTVPYAMEANFTTTIYLSNLITDPSAFIVRIKRDRGGVVTILRSTGNVLVPASGTGYAELETRYQRFETGDELFVTIEYNAAAYGGAYPGPPNSAIVPDSEFKVDVTRYIVPGEVFDLAQALPDKPQIWFIREIAKAFNLKFATDVVRRKVIIEPDDDFYLPISEAVDYTNKLDFSQEISHEFYSDLVNKKQVFRFINDEQDGYVKAMNLVTPTEPLHGYVHELPERFAKGEDVTELDFAATTYINDKKIRAVGYGLSIDIPRIWLENTTGLDYPPSSYDFAPRMLFYDGMRTGSWYWYSAGNVETSYPYLFAVDIHGTAGDETSLVWQNINGMPGLFRSHYYPHFKRVQEGRIVNAWFYLTPQDIANLSFRKPIKITTEDGWEYYYIEKVKDYKPDGHSTTQLSLFKAIAVDATSITDSDKPIIDGKDVPIPKGGGGGFMISKTYTDSADVLINDYGTPSYVLMNGTDNQAEPWKGGVSMGIGTISTGANIMVTGSYNVENGDAIFIIGGGTDNDNRKNVMEVYANGDVKVWDCTAESMIFLNECTE